jgi:hypothetical protein
MIEMKIQQTFESMQNVHFLISTIVVLKIKNAEECAIILGVMCWHKYIRESPDQNVRE